MKGYGICWFIMFNIFALKIPLFGYSDLFLYFSNLFFINNNNKTHLFMLYHIERDHCVKILMYKLYNLVAVCLRLVLVC